MGLSGHAQSLQTQLKSGALELSQADLDALLTATEKVLDGSSPAVRRAVAQFLGYVLATMYQAAKDEGAEAGGGATPAKAGKKAASRKKRHEASLTMDEVLTHLGQAFAKATCAPTGGWYMAKRCGGML